MPTRQQFEEAAAAIRGLSPLQPKVALVLGSGLNPLADAGRRRGLDRLTRDIPHFPVSTIAGHQGRLVIGQLENKPVIVMQGRAHYYEGYSMQQVTLPVRVFRQLGVEMLILTNAAGGLNKAFRTGDMMLIDDHINLVGMAGENPLRGPNDPELGPRFLDMSKTYDRELRRLALAVAAEENLPLHQGRLRRAGRADLRDAGRCALPAHDRRRRGRHVHRAGGHRRPPRRHARAWASPASATSPSTQSTAKARPATRKCWRPARCWCRG